MTMEAANIYFYIRGQGPLPWKGNYSSCSCLPDSFVHQEVFKFDLRNKLWMPILY